VLECAGELPVTEPGGGNEYGYYSGWAIDGQSR
jgi:hypothetical protein